MRRPVLFKVILIVVLLAGVLTRTIASQAQTAASLMLTSFDPAGFPAMTATFRVYDPGGNFISGLEPGSLRISEDERLRPMDSLEEVYPGVQFVVAIDPGPAFIARDTNGVTRFAKVVSALSGWAAESTPPGGEDDLSLITTTGPSLVHIPREDFQTSLTEYGSNLREPTPSLQTLTRALDVVAEPAPQIGMQRAILLIISPVDTGTLPVLQNLTARAVEQQIRVYVWIVAPQDFFTLSGATALKDLAIQTGGQFALFSGAETLPSPEMYLQSLRPLYSLTYTSALATSGEHMFSLRVTLEDQGELTVSQPFELDVQPPNPILVSPPVQIIRQSPDQAIRDLAAFLPTEQGLEIIIEFPDGHPRLLQRTILYVNGEQVAVNTGPVFDTFRWDLRDYTVSGQHLLQVEVVDSLGLSRVSMGVPVMITVVKPPSGLRAFLASNNVWVVVGAVVIAGGVLAAVLIGARVRRASRAAGRQADDDLLTQPILAEAGEGRRALPWTRHPKPAPAYLVRLKADGQPVSAAPIPLTGSEMTFGTDPTQATHLLNDPSVSPLHARLKRLSDSEFVLNDEKSVAGTWVNYTMLTQAGTRLEHGDVIHFGQLSYRFMLRIPPERRKPRIKPLEP